jgi:hypothetical protein
MIDRTLIAVVDAATSDLAREPMVGLVAADRRQGRRPRRGVLRGHP